MVWKHLVDAGAWNTWDSGVDSVDGEVAPGATVKIRSKAAPGRTFPVKVTTFDKPSRLVFSGGMPLGLFRGVRTYTLTPLEDGGTEFHMREEYSGPMLGLIWKSIPDLSPSFEQFAQGLKKVAESRN